MKKITLYLLILFAMSACAKRFTRYPMNPQEKVSAGEFKSSLKDNPKDELSHQALGVLYLQKNYVNRSLKHLEKAVALNPNNAEALAWFGAARAKKGAELSGWYCFGINKISAVKDGVKCQNRAVEMEPKNLVVRMVRASTHISLRGRFSDFSVAQKDLEFIKKQNLPDPQMEYYIAYLDAKHHLVKMRLEDRLTSNKKQKIIQKIEKVVQHLPKNSSYYPGIVEDLEKIKKSEE